MALGQKIVLTQKGLKMDNSNSRVVCGMVLGEASESDDDSDSAQSSENRSHPFLTNNNNKASKRSPRHKLKYNTLLHYKLRDDNIGLRNDFINAVEQPVIRAQDKMTESLQLQSKTRVSLHEVPRYLHQLSVALVGLQDRLPCVCKTNIVPKV